MIVCLRARTHTHIQYTYIWVDTHGHMHTWNILHMHIHMYVCVHIQRLSLAFPSLRSNLLGVCVTLGIFCNLYLSFLISRMRSVVIFMAWDCGQDTIEECMK